MLLESERTMFDGCANELPPTTLEDCIRKDTVISNLWEWARRIEIYGKLLMILTILIGVLLSFTTSSSYTGDFSMISCITNLVTYGIGAFVEYCTYHVIALLIGSLARIVQSNRTMAKLMELEYRKNHAEE